MQNLIGKLLVLSVLVLIPAAAKAESALAELSGPSGPLRFAVVRDGLYRGGQPTSHHLALLRACGVDTIVDLRLPDRALRDEAAEAARLGLRFVSRPFTGLARVDGDFLTSVVNAIRSGGHVYVHCNLGRDRTSLVIALSRVLLDGWAAPKAWEHEAVAYGYKGGLFHRTMVQSFDSAVRLLARQP